MKKVSKGAVSVLGILAVWTVVWTVMVFFALIRVLRDKELLSDMQQVVDRTIADAEKLKQEVQERVVQDAEKLRQDTERSVEKFRRGIHVKLRK